MDATDGDSAHVLLASEMSLGLDATDAHPRGRDESDARPGLSAGTPSQVATMPVERDSDVYNMCHRRRGTALIFNHMRFDPRLGLKDRKGTDADRDNLTATLRTLDFDVRVYDDLAHKEIERVLEACAFDEDHSDADCLLIAVLSHGELGIL
jgi:caspase-like apoptosis-related cysteine protease